jgi:hypothetical protein
LNFYAFAMRSVVVTPRFLPAILFAWVGLSGVAQAQPGAFHGKNGSVILRMCQSADRVKTLSAMCHSYLDGYIDAAHHYAKGKPAFCLADGDRKHAPGAVVAWIGAHPESLAQPAATVLQKALAERFPCKGRP